MLFVILGIIIGLAIMWIGERKRWQTFNTACIAILILIIFVAVIPGLIHSGYESPRLEQTVELEPLSHDSDLPESHNTWYVAFDGEYTYRYKVENDTEFSGTMYKTETVSGNVKEIESPDCKTPTLYVYVEKSKNSVWFSYHLEERVTYVFCVPEKNMNLD